MTGPTSFAWPVRIYWEDTDAGGIVYYANYLKFMERARTEWLRSVGVEQELLQRAHGLMFVVVEAETRFLKPARYGELLQVSCDIAEARRASLTFRQNIARGGARNAASDEVLVTGRVRVACLDARKFRPHALPDEMLHAMNVAGEG